MWVLVVNGRLAVMNYSVFQMWQRCAAAVIQAINTFRWFVRPMAINAQSDFGANEKEVWIAWETDFIRNGTADESVERRHRSSAHLVFTFSRKCLNFANGERELKAPNLNSKSTPHRLLRAVEFQGAGFGQSVVVVTGLIVNEDVHPLEILVVLEHQANGRYFDSFSQLNGEHGPVVCDVEARCPDSIGQTTRQILRDGYFARIGLRYFNILPMQPIFNYKTLK